MLKVKRIPCGTCQGSRRFLQDNSGTSESIISVKFTVGNNETAILPKAEEVTVNMEAQTAAITDILQADTGLSVLEVTPSSVPSSMPSSQPSITNNETKCFTIAIPNSTLETTFTNAKSFSHNAPKCFTIGITLTDFGFLMYKLHSNGIFDIS